MGQFLLGLRSLFLRLAIFIVFAALLVWFLGGNLLAKPVVIPHGTIACGAKLVHIVQVIPPLDSLPSERETWHIEIASQSDDDEWKIITNAQVVVRATEISRAPNGALWFAGASSGLAAWTIFEVDCEQDALIVRGSGYPNRLAVERQLSRIASGRALQSPEVAAGAQDAVLNAGD
ncbi:MAG: hypothetical protein EXS10_00975 [Phycisphaerales bacterium]|nr:hypothetical protein [Phycisphaerales bacterium]